jgi:hypothetical protein
MKKKLGTEPAFSHSGASHTQYAPSSKEQRGMSKRFYAACAAMQGIAANPELKHYNIESLTRTAYGFADELLKQENK